MQLCLALALSLIAGIACAEGAQVLSVHPFTGEGPDFGGFSAIEVSDDGTRFWALTDRAHLATGRFERSGGQITKVSVEGMQRLLGPKGIYLPNNVSDAEGLARRADGRLYVSFEGYHRVWTYSAPGSGAAWIPRHDDFKTMQINSGLEALAIAPDGALITLPERSGGVAEPFPLYRYAGGTWAKPQTLPRDFDWLPTGADFGPDGALYVLTRRFTGISFASRITRYWLPDTGEVTGPEVLYESAPGVHGNLEGLAIWQDGDGALRALMITDDNFRSIQRSEIIEIFLPQ